MDRPGALRSNQHGPVAVSRRGGSLRGEPIVEVLRGGQLESVHCVAACISDDRGVIAGSLGEIDAPVFLRSSIKPFIAAAVIASGAADAFGFDDADIALIAASHSGEPGHIASARSILEKAAIPESALRCGLGEAASVLHHNCSGKHAGILALSKMTGAPLDGYLEPGHAAQRAILALNARMFGVEPGSIAIAVDGCGIPTLAVPLRAASLGFARFATLRGLVPADAAALARVKAAMRSRPWHVAGSGAFDTRLIEATRGGVVGKGGAEGVHADALEAQGLGLALKVLDGARRAVAPAAIALLENVGALDAAARKELAEFARPTLRNAADLPVGSIEARLPPSPAFKRS